MRIETKPPMRLALFVDYETRQNISICLYIWLVRCIGNTAPTCARSVPREISTPLRKRDVSWIRSCVFLSPNHLRHPSPHDSRQCAVNNTLNASMVHDTCLWTFWIFVTCYCDLFIEQPVINWAYRVIFNVEKDNACKSYCKESDNDDNDTYLIHIHALL